MIQASESKAARAAKGLGAWCLPLLCSEVQPMVSLRAQEIQLNTNAVSPQVRQGRTKNG